MVDPRIVVIEHPLGGTEPDAIITRAAAARGKVRDLVGVPQSD